MMVNNKSITVFMPVYNESKIINATIYRLVEVMESLSRDYEILLIDDGSTDDSKNKILEWTKRNNTIRLIEHKVNEGYGAALRSGFMNAKNDLIFYTDSDMPIDLRDIEKALPFMEKYDMVIGYRINRKDTLRRFIYSKGYNFLLQLFFKVKVKDANFSFKCVKREVIQKCRLRAKSVFIDGELLVEAARNSFVIKEIPIMYIPRKHGTSNFNSLKMALFTLRELLAYWKTCIKNRRNEV